MSLRGYIIIFNIFYYLYCVTYSIIACHGYAVFFTAMANSICADDATVAVTKAEFTAVQVACYLKASYEKEHHIYRPALHKGMSQLLLRELM